jgi:hypothetical protein
MSNYSNQMGLIHFQLFTKYNSDIKEALYLIFQHDCDFTENEEYFRKNTLKLGYKNEAERLVSEYVNKHRIDTLSKVTTAVDKLAANIFNNSNYYSEHHISVDEIDEHTFSVAIAYGY